MAPLGRADLSHRRPTALPGFLFGCDYYPEHWDAALREHDPARMQAAGFNIVRMGEFAWDRIEPEEGQYDFSLFDETIERLSRHGISTVFCTPTATPPRWLTYHHAEILRVNAEGAVMQHGSRQHACTIHPLYREYSRTITRALAAHFQENPHVVGWQTDNEMNLHFNECHCASCQREFGEYLRLVFDNDIDALNRTLGTAFWAQTYGNFEEIQTVRLQKPHTVNPALLLMYYRFMAFGAARFQHEQVEILRAAQPRWWVTHNSPGGHIHLRGLFLRDLDMLGHDHYPTFHQDPETRPANQAFTLDTMRSFGGNFIVMEHQSGAGGSRLWALDTPEPGEVRLMTYACIARGADSLLYFRWRSCRFGAEIYWRGILDHDNVPRRLYHEIAGIGAEVDTVGQEVLGTSVAVDVAVASGDVDVLDAHQAHHLGLPSPAQIAEEIHQYYYQHGYAAGCVHPADDLSGIKLFFLTHWAMFDPAYVAGLERWVREGGTLVIGGRTATRNMYNNVLPDRIPGPLRELAGVTVTEYGYQVAPDKRPLDFVVDGETVHSTLWYEQLELAEGTMTYANWQTRHLAGTPAISLRQVGQGRVVYVGTYLTPEVIAVLGPKLASMAGLQPLLPSAPDGVEVVHRENADKRLWFILNHNEQAVSLNDLPHGVELISGMIVAGGLTLEARGVAVIKECR